MCLGIVTGFVTRDGSRVRVHGVRVQVGKKNPGKTRTRGTGLSGFDGLAACLQKKKSPL